jgi:hypothetical protein
VNFQFVASIGDHFTICEFSLEEFENLHRIDLLPFRPLNSMKEAPDIMERFSQRGKMYEKIAVKSCFMGYMQGSFYAKATGGRSAISALRSDGRVMVDTVGAYDAGHSISTGYDGMIHAVQQKAKECVAYLRQLRQASNRATSMEHKHSVSDDHLLLLKSIPSHLLASTWPAVTGFSFTRKVWGDVLVDGLFEIEYAEATFGRLVLPPARKRMIKALVRHSNDTVHDIVSGKGEGSVFLLFGPPGCGKTLTAEAISEMLHRPLYSVSIGQLGTTPAELESKLGEILDLCSRWDALILLDEADLFLEKRTHGGSLERNAMVSVMLRLVEYFKGVLFLTSNRVDSLDPAFKTRITLALNYEPLDEAAREQVWRNLLEASGQVAVLEQGLIHTQALAQYKLNGREIKNSIRLALSLAAEDGISLSQACLLETVEMLCHVNENLESSAPY